MSPRQGKLIPHGARGEVRAEVRLEPGFAIGGRERQWMLAFSGAYWLANP